MRSANWAGWARKSSRIAGTRERSEGSTETPEDPFDPAAYPPLSSETQAKIQKLLNYYGTSFASIYNAINNRDARRPYFYYDYDDLTPGPVFNTTAELADWASTARESYDYQELEDFRTKFMSSCDGHATERLIEAAQDGKRVTFTLEADWEHNCETESFYCMLDGQNGDEAVIVNTHTDGVNCIEENGPAALIALLRALRDKPLHVAAHPFAAQPFGRRPARDGVIDPLLPIEVAAVQEHRRAIGEDEERLLANASLDEVDVQLARLPAGIAFANDGWFAISTIKTVSAINAISAVKAVFSDALRHSQRDARAQSAYKLSTFYSHFSVKSFQ